MTEYVSRLEQRYQAQRDVPTATDLVAEVERFLREQN
jgi:hypothetical protein